MSTSPSLKTSQSFFIYTYSLSLAIFPFIKSGEISKIKALLEAGAYVNFQDRDTNNQTPLHAAARIGDREIVELFLSKGIDKNLVDSNYFTASRIAEIHGFNSIASLIDNY